MILAEYEEFFEMKFSKPPKLVKKANENSGALLPKIQKKGSSSLISAEKKTKNTTTSQ